MDAELRRQLLEAYKIGWSDCLVGDMVRSLDYQSEDEIIERIVQELERLKNRAADDKRH